MPCFSIVVKAIYHEEQRYDTVGDWWFEDDCLHVRVSRVLSQTEQWCVALHEIVEALLCKHKYGTSATCIVDKWDFSHMRAKEPGELKNCPYKREHTIASIAEQILELELMK
jgi:hypothetical protein